jgi:hypothetical protein
MLPSSERYLALLKLAANARQQLLSPAPDPNVSMGFIYPDAATLKLSAADVEADLEQLCELGYLERQFAERGYYCPDCQHHALMFRETCPACASSNVEIGDLLHHFRCGHTAPESDFQDGVRYTCRKCGHQLRHIGVDYERPASSYLCRACNYVSSEPETRCLCLKCGKQHPADRAELRTVYAYRLNARGGLAVSRGELGDARGAGGLFDTEFGLYAFSYFDERLTQEVAASKRYKRPLSLMLVAFRETDFPAGSQAASEAMRRLVAGAKDSLRDCDCAALFREDCLVALLVDTDAAGAPFAFKRLQDTVDRLGGDGGAPIALDRGLVTLDDTHATARAFFDDVRAKLHDAQMPAAEPALPASPAAE